MLGRYARNLAILFAAVGLMLTYQSTAFCQNQGGGNQGGGNLGGGGGGNLGGGAGTGQATGGIEVDAMGVLKARTINGNAALLDRQRFAAAQAAINKDLQRPSRFRKISLTRLEKEVKKLVDAGQPIPPEMRYLAGMTKITNVFFYPETNDIVIAGPAEGFYINAANHVVGMKSGVATLQLQDLIVALRC